MSHLTYFAKAFNAHYSQATRIGDQIIISGQPGLNRVTREIPKDFRAEIEQALRNVDQYVKEAGGKGISQVYKLVVYLAPMDAETTGILGEVLPQWFPDHAPVLTGIGVEKLALDWMKVEIEAWAHVPTESE